MVEVAQLVEVFIQEHGMLQLQLGAVKMRFVKKVALAADEAHERHDQMFPVGVDGWIGDLGEELLEIVVEKLRAVRQHGKGGVVPHGKYGFLGVLRHGLQHDGDLFAAVAVEPLTRKKRSPVDAHRTRRLKETLEFDPVLFEPVPVGLAPGYGRLDFIIVEDAVAGSIDQEHLSRCQASLLQDLFGRDVEHAHLGGHDHLAALGDDIAGRPQTVAVEGGADFYAIGKGKGGRAVPRLHDRGMVFVKCPFVFADVVLGAERLGHHHGHGMLDGAAA